MKIRVWVVSGFVLAMAVACSRKKEPSAEGSARGPTPGSASAASQSAAPSLPPSALQSTAQTAAPNAAPIPAAVAAGSDSEPPVSFAGGKKEVIDGAVGLGCEARSASGWLELVCRRKNGSGGHPVRAQVDGDVEEPVQADEHGELRLVLPFREGSSKELTLEWSDTKYFLQVQNATAKLEWSGANLALRRACAALGDESRARISAAQKADAEGRVLPNEAAKLPRFATCVQAGHGSWAIGLESIAGASEGAERKLVAALEIVHISESGQRLTGSLGKLEFGPAGLELPTLRAYDYDDDGNDEAIVSYELRARPASAALPELGAIWSVSESGVAPYAKSPKLAAGGSGVEQLDFDMRPDLGDFGPFIAWLAPGCGVKDCPARLTGPRFFWHSLPDGGFSNADAAAKEALKRACPKKPAGVVVANGGPLNAVQTAKSLVCARAWGMTSEAVDSELTAKASVLCGEGEACTLSQTLHAWAKAELPFQLE